MAKRTSKEPTVNSGSRNGNGNGDSAEATINRLQLQLNEYTQNTLLRGQEFFQQLIDPRRNISDECGYPQVIKRKQYRDLYDREPIAARVVEIEPEESWCTQPSIYEEEDSDTITEFEQAWDDLGKSLRGRSWYQDEESSPVWEFLKRADKLSGIGQFGLILLGIDDIKEGSSRSLRDPIEAVEKAMLAGPVENAAPKTRPKLLFLRVFDEQDNMISSYDTNPASPRFGQPTMYNIELNDPNASTDQLAGGLSTGTAQVHWTRVIHVADNLNSSEVFGVARMQTVFNCLADIQKVRGGSAEMYWRGAFPGLSIETHPQLGGDVQIDATRSREQIEQYQNSLQRFLLLAGMSAKTLAPQVVDPTAQINVQIEAICIRKGIPIPVFKGYEIGEQASSNNDKDWKKRMGKRQREYITPRIIVPFVDRLIQIGVLPEPVGYSTDWPDMYSLSETEQADITVKRTQAIAQYGDSPGAQTIITPLDFWMRVVGLDDEEAASIVEAAEEHALEIEAEELIEQEEQQSLADDQGFKPTPPEGFIDPKMMPPKPAFGKPATGGKPGGKPFAPKV